MNLRPIVVGAACALAVLASSPGALASGSARSALHAHIAPRGLTGSVTLGSTTLAPQPCMHAFTIAQYTTGAGEASYVVPDDGVITSFSHRANATVGAVRLVVMGGSSVAGHRTVVGFSTLQPVTVSSLNTFATRIPVKAGTSLALQTNAVNMGCVGLSGLTDTAAAQAAPYDPTTTPDFPGTTVAAGLLVNVSAVVEPDADGDGFGDVTQDACPQSAASQAPCPAPDTKTKKPQRLVNGKVSIRLKSSIPGSTFTCAVDRSKAKPCTSPFEKRLSVGRHKLVVTAVSPVGIPDPTPVKVRFRVARRG